MFLLYIYLNKIVHQKKMSLDMFIRPLDRKTVEEIAKEFPVFKQTSDIKFENLNGVNYGCFSALINDANATMCYLTYGWCVIVAPGVILPPTELTPPREYLVNLVEIDLETDIISIWECNSGTGMAKEIARYAFDKWNTSGVKSSCTFPILIPRLENNRKNLIGFAIMKTGREIKIEFKRDGKIIPKLN